MKQIPDYVQGFDNAVSTGSVAIVIGALLIAFWLLIKARKP